VCPPYVAMTYDPAKHHRRSNRLLGYDYSQAAPYFVTICVQEHLCLLGDVIDGEMVLNAAGLMIGKWWKELENKFSGVRLDRFGVMPNHMHSILVIMGTGMDMVTEFGIGLDELNLDGADANEGIVPSRDGTRGEPPLQPSLGDVIQWFKTMTTNEYIRGVRESGWPRFEGKLWQRDYFDHIVRNAESLELIRNYIRDNPLRWSLDRENPNRTGDDKFDEWLLDQDDE
jgi:putative transposase